MEKVFRNAARLVITSDDKILLCKMGDIRGLPGGGIEWGETIKNALEREAIEELGIKAEFEDILFIQDYLSGPEDGDKRKHFTEFFCTIKNNSDFKDVTKTYLESSHAFELLDLAWFDISNIPKEMMPQTFIPVLKEYLESKSNGNLFGNYISGIN